MRRCTPDEAAQLLRPDDTLGVPLGPGQPRDLLHALGRRGDFTSLTVFAALLTDFFPVFTQPGVRLLSGFFGPVERALESNGHDIAFVPGDFRRFARIVRRLDPRVMATAASPPDADGRVSLSLHAGATVDELQRCGRDPERLLVVEVSPHFPRTLGVPPENPHALTHDEIDVLVESEAEPISLADPPAGEAARAIADHVASLVPEGATLQTGIGGIPGAVVELLAQGPGGDYGVHSEMFTTGLMHLHRAGKVSNRKGVYDGISVTTFAMGTRELYEWLEDREDVRFLPVHLVNDPSRIGQNRRMVSINGALAIDLAGQVAADSVAGRHYSGIGGHEDFVAGAGLAGGGRSLICVPSTVTIAGERLSRIVSAFPAGAKITTPRHHVDAVVTEYGVAELEGRTEAERAEALAAVAHPEFREGLRAGGS